MALHGAVAAGALLAVLLFWGPVPSALAAPTSSSWPASGGGPFRQSQARVADSGAGLADPNTGVEARRRRRGAALDARFAPLATPAGLLVACRGGGAQLLFLDPTAPDDAEGQLKLLLLLNVSGVSAAFAGLAVAAPPALDESGSAVVLALVDVSGAGRGGFAAALSAVAGVGLGGVMWGPVGLDDIDLVASADPLIGAGAAVFVGASGRFARLALPQELGTRLQPLRRASQPRPFLPSNGCDESAALNWPCPSRPPTPLFLSRGIVPLCVGGSQNDSVAAPPTLLSSAGTFIVVSLQGCASAVSASGAVLWSLPRPLGVFGDVLAAPAADVGSSGGRGLSGEPIVATGATGLGRGKDESVRISAGLLAARAYFLFSGGSLCCAAAADGATCAGWPALCVALPTVDLVLSGLAVAPDAFDWHGGAVYAADANGTLFAVAAASGTVASSEAGTLPGAAFSAPIVVPDAWGADNNALLVVTSTNGGVGDAGGASSVSAWAVGSNGDHDDDDARDDDGSASTGLTWRQTLPADAGAIASRGGAAMLADGSLALVTAAGDLLLVGRSHDALEVDSAWLGITITAACVSVGAALFGAAFIYARRRRRAARLKEEAGDAAAAAAAAVASTDSSGADSLEAPLLSLD